MISNELQGEVEYLSSLTPTQAAREALSLHRVQSLLVLWWIRQCPFSGISDLAGFTNLGAGTLDALTGDLKAEGFIGVLDLGCLFQAKSRYYLQQKGYYHLAENLNIDLEWTDTEEGLLAVRRFFPIAESLYPLASRLFSTGAVVPLPVELPADRSLQSRIYRLDQDTRLERFRWLRSGQAAVRTALADYETRDGDALQVVFVWQGLQHRNGALANAMEEIYGEMTWIPDPQYGGPPRPTGLVIVVPDQLGALRVRTQLHASVPAGIVDQYRRVIRPMQPLYPRGILGPPKEEGLRLGRISNLPQRIAAEPGLALVSSVPRHRAIRAIELYPELNKAGYAELLRSNRKTVAADLTSFVSDGIVELDGGRHKLSNRGHRLVGRLDRTCDATVRGRYNTGRNQPLHKRGLSRITLRFRKEHIDVAPEWRLVCNVQGVSQVKPDLWVLVPGEDGTFVWYAVEYERTAKTPTQWAEKQEPYRTLLNQDFPVPCLMICETADAAEVCERFGNDVPMLVCTYRDFLRGKFAGAESIWRHNGAVVDMSFLPRAPASFLVTNTSEGAVAYH